MEAYQIEIRPFQFLQLRRCDISVHFNKHAFAYVEGIISEENAATYIDLSLRDTKASISCMGEKGEQIVLFQGLLFDVEVENTNGVYQIRATLVSGTILMDLSENTRTFQNASFTVRDLLDTMDNHPDYAYIALAGDDQPIEKMIVQFKESNWEFVKRLASRYHTRVLPAYRHDGVRFYFGIPKHGNEIPIRPVSWQAKRDIAGYQKKAEDGIPLHESDELYYIVEDRKVYQIGDPVSFMGRSLLVYSIESKLVGQELMHFYVLKTLAGFQTRTYSNLKITGASLDGAVTNVANDVVQVQLQVDPDPELSGIRWLPYSTVYSSPDGSGWYAMPEPGDHIRLYFPTEHEEQGYVISSTNLEAADGASRTNPNHKSLKNAQGKEIRLTETQIIMTNNQKEAGNEMTIIIDDEQGISIISDKDIILDGKENVILNSTEGGLGINAKTQVSVSKTPEEGAGAELVIDAGGVSYTGQEVHLQ